MTPAIPLHLAAHRQTPWLSGLALPLRKDASAVVLLLVMAAGTLVPFLTFETLPFVDWPNHLARLHALAAEPGSAIGQTYAAHWALIPDLGCDLVYLACKGWLSPETALRLCLTGALFLVTAAVWRMQWILFRTTSYAVALTPLMATGLSVSMGYVNYVMSVSIGLAGTALTIGWRSRLSMARVACLCGLATLSWFAHVAGFCVFGFVLAILFLSERPCMRRSGQVLPLTLTQLGCAYLVVLGPGVLLSACAERQGFSGGIGYGEGLQKMRFLLAPWLATADMTSLAVLPLCLGLVILVCRFGSLRLSPVLKPVVLLLAGLVVMLPWQIGDAIDVDARLVLPLTALLLAGTRVCLPSRVLPHVACVTLVLLSAMLRVHAMEQAASATGREVGAFRRAAALLPIGSALMVARDADPPGTCSQTGENGLALLHLGSYAAIDRGAYVPTMFTASGMQPLRVTRAPFQPRERPIMPPSFALIDAVAKAGDVEQASLTSQGDPGLAREFRAMTQSRNVDFLRHWPDGYDALLVLHDGCPRRLMASRLSTLAEDRRFTLYRINARSTAW